MCSRSQAVQLVQQGRVRVDGRRITDPEHPTDLQHARLDIDGVRCGEAARVYIALNKPRGLVTTRSDERGRDTVYACLAQAGLPWLAPVGRLDKASEGLLLFSNDPQWAAAITEGGSVPKTYHVQLRGLPDPPALARLRAGIHHEGEWLQAARVDLLRHGERSAWLEFELHQGRNRQIRRMLEAVGHPVLRLVRVRIGPVALGELAKGALRPLTPAEVAALGAVAAPLSARR